MCSNFWISDLDRASQRIIDTYFFFGEKRSVLRETVIAMPRKMLTSSAASVSKQIPWSETHDFGFPVHSEIHGSPFVFPNIPLTQPYENFLMVVTRILLKCLRYRRCGNTKRWGHQNTTGPSVAVPKTADRTSDVDLHDAARIRIPRCSIRSLTPFIIRERSRTDSRRFLKKDLI